MIHRTRSYYQHKGDKALSPGNFAGFLVFPVASLLQWPVKGNGPRSRTIIDAAATIPAFIRMQNYGWFAFLGIGDKDINLANLYTMVAAIADIGIIDNRPVGSGDIGYSICFFSHINLLIF
jgi:hypothetical protein